MAEPDAHGPERVDERDTLFARMERRPGTPAHADYYGRHPQRRAVDDRLRAMPPLFDPRGEHYDAETMRAAAACFEAIARYEVEEDEALVATWAQRLADTRDPTATVKAMLAGLGAVAVGCTALDPAYVYTHKGRFDADYGRPVALAHAHALVFLVEMDHGPMQQAPRAPTLLESARQYERAARIARTAAAALRRAGHDAKAHYDAHYDVVLPPLAVRAGLGELGRNNILVADRFGSRVRIGAVTTDLEADHDRPLSRGVTAFCRGCAKCAELCPSHALSQGDPEVVRGVEKWPTHVERCHAWWRRVGTDCGICMAACPFSHPAGGIHRVVRALVRRAPWLDRTLLRLDDLIYGRARWRSPVDREQAAPPPADDASPPHGGPGS
jgi:ferredoxin